MIFKRIGDFKFNSIAMDSPFNSTHFSVHFLIMVQVTEKINQILVFNIISKLKCDWLFLFIAQNANIMS